jgi:hypothetical protein
VDDDDLGGNVLPAFTAACIEIALQRSQMRAKTPSIELVTITWRRGKVGHPSCPA